MPYKYVKTEVKEHKAASSDAPKITETKEVEKPKTLTEEESQLKTIKENEDKFFDEDDEIIEVNWD